MKQALENAQRVVHDVHAGVVDGAREQRRGATGEPREDDGGC